MVRGYDITYMDKEQMEGFLASAHARVRKGEIVFMVGKCGSCGQILYAEWKSQKEADTIECPKCGWKGNAKQALSSPGKRT